MPSMLTFLEKRERLTLRFRARLMLSLGRAAKCSLLFRRRGLNPNSGSQSGRESSRGVESEMDFVSTAAADAATDSTIDCFDDAIVDDDSDVWSLTSAKSAVSHFDIDSDLSPPPPTRPATSTFASLVTPQSSVKRASRFLPVNTPSSPVPFSTPSSRFQQQHHQQHQQQHLVPSHRKNHLPKSKSSNDLKSERMRNFLHHGILRQSERVLKNRGLCLPPVDASSKGKWNLGNLLHITDKYIPDLDEDPNQAISQPKLTRAVLPDGRNIVQIQSLRFSDKPFDRKLFDAAQQLVFAQFAEKNVNADLDGVLDDDFTVDVITDPVTGIVLGAVEYVFMKRYLWIDAIAVHHNVRGLGVGSIMLERLRNIASIRKKTLLCFALHDVCPWYKKQGFVLATEFPELPWHIGKFLLWTPNN